MPVSVLPRSLRLSLRVLCLSGFTAPLFAAAPTESRLLETAARRGSLPAVIFTEGRETPREAAKGVPEAWEKQLAATRAAFSGTARPGEFFVFQIGVRALAKDVGPLAIDFPAMTGAGENLPASAWKALSLGGVGYDGKPFSKTLLVPAGATDILWVGVQIPTGARGLYRGTLNVGLGSGKTAPLDLALTVDGAPVTDNGDSVAKNLSRLRWLDSTVGSEETLTKPYTQVALKDRTVGVLGRELKIGRDGLPEQALSYFSSGNTAITTTGRPVLKSPMRFAVATDKGPVAWRATPGSFTRTDLEANWTSSLRAEGLEAEVAGKLDYTGSGEVRIRLKATRDITLADAGLETAYAGEASRYFLGLNVPGGLRRNPVDWHWDVKKRQDCFWMGDVNAGMMLRFKDESYVRPLVNIYYDFRPLKLPRSWGNAGQGGIRVAPAADGSVLATAYSGARKMRKGESLDFTFELYLTPFRPIEPEKQWAVRYIHPHPSHSPEPLDKALEAADPKHGPNVVTVHQATYYNPYINYPYSDDSYPAFSDFVKRGHDKGVGVRVYYTTREITHNMPELVPLHAFNGELIHPGAGKAVRTMLHPNGPAPWLVDTLVDNFIPAWVDQIGGKYAQFDYSVITTPDSRWNNFFLEGLNHMLKTDDIDGIYIDDTALDASSFRRARRMLDTRPGRTMDLHTWNQFHGAGGYAHNMTIYMDAVPYMDRLWLGEAFDCNAAAWDFWLVEMSGIPFGVMGEMLQSPNPWRGLVFGETGRLGWSGDPRAVWKVWDEFGIQGTEFIPFTAPECPVRTGVEEIKASVYKKQGRTFVALGSWSKKLEKITLAIDWKALGLDPKKTSVYAPPIRGFQAESRFNSGDTIPVRSGRGWFLVLDEVVRDVAPSDGSGAGAVVTFEDFFSQPTLDAGWTMKVSKDASATSAANALRLKAPANTFAGIEKTLPPGTIGVEIVVEAGTDAGQDWGPGAVLTDGYGSVAKINLRLEDMRYGLYVDGEFKIADTRIDRKSTRAVRILLQEKSVTFRELTEDEGWVIIDTLPRKKPGVEPTLLRLGKTAMEGAWRDHPQPGPAGECAIKSVKVLGR